MISVHPPCLLARRISQRSTRTRRVHGLCHLDWIWVGQLILTSKRCLLHLHCHPTCIMILGTRCHSTAITATMLMLLVRYFAVITAKFSSGHMVDIARYGKRVIKTYVILYPSSTADAHPFQCKHGDRPQVFESTAVLSGSC
jgi:hypothetical protein